MKKMIFASATAVAVAFTGHAQMVEDYDNNIDEIAPGIVVDYMESQAFENVPTGFIPEEMEMVTLFPENDEIVELEIDAEDGISEEEVANALSELQTGLVDYAKSLLGRPYVWGSKGPKSFDCSGFTGYVYKNFGYNIGAGSRHQATMGKKVDIKDARVGDLIFFTRPKAVGSGTVGHVGMVIDVNPDGSLKFIHASSKKGVVIQDFPDKGHYNRRFLQVRRMVDDDKLASTNKTSTKG